MGDDECDLVAKIGRAAADKFRARLEESAQTGARFVLVAEVGEASPGGFLSLRVRLDPPAASLEAARESPDFAAALALALARYDPARVIPIVVVDVAAPLTGLRIVGLPWVSAAADHGCCEACGCSRPPPASAPPCHRCLL